MNHPDDLRYTQSHEWVRADGDRATVGITDYAQLELGDIVYLDLPKSGRALKQEDVFGAVESVKAVSDLYAPVSGEVVEVNEALSDAPEEINADPYERGWMIRIRVSNPAELDGLMTAAQYGEFIGRQ
jgi:glycine cleavage system H protein